MKPLKVAQKMRPFFRRPGARFLLSNGQEVQVFPTKVLLHEGGEVSLPVEGPVEDFFAMQNFDRGYVEVSGKGQAGFFRFYVTEKGVQEQRPPAPAKSFSMLSLGSSKAQDWDQVYRRADLKEVLPIWWQLVQALPEPQGPPGKGGTFELLQALKNSLGAENPEKIYQAFQNLWRGAFRGVLCPRLGDEYFQGLCEGAGEGDPLHLLFGGFYVLSELFLKADETSLALLPHCPPQFVSGRLLKHRLPWGEVDLEWSKKEPRLCFVRPSMSLTLEVKLPSSIRRCRLRRSKKDSGVTLERPVELLLEEGEEVLLDYFEA